MGEYRFSLHVAAPPEQVFDLWVGLDRAHEWIGGLRIAEAEAKSLAANAVPRQAPPA